jgi:NAD(P)-dependent dehydrogenase (short-subunit alcohol dehydrogenase family)
MPRGARQLLLAGGAAAGAAAIIARRKLATAAFDLDGRTAIVTGGSRGLGLLIAKELGMQGARVTLAARDSAELERARDELTTCGLNVAIAPCDVRHPREAEQLVMETLDRTGRLDILVNCAGVIQVGPLAHMITADFEDAMAVHFWGPFHTMRAAVPEMRRLGGGRIVNIASIGGRIGVPHLAPYCASKFALAGFSDAIRAELARDGIKVTTVSPGLMRTGSPFNARFKGRHRDEFTWFAISDSLPLATIDATRAARRIVNACRRGAADLVVPWPFRLAILANAVAPGAVAAGMRLTNRFILPAPTDDSGDVDHTGWQSASRWAPSRLTRLTERAAARNNEIPP